MTLVFVYGTLKRTFENHRYLEGQVFAGTAQTPPGFTLYELAGYPGMVSQDGDLEGVRGEVWAVDDACLARLDELEGVAEGLYAREPVPLGAPFQDKRVEAYFYLRGTEGRPRVGSDWPG
jgi:gamma-glutamylaminecyclotransferase